MSSAHPNPAALEITSDDLIRQRLRARRISLTGKQPVSSVIAGVHSSRFRGRGVDYVESRNYEIGDDIRNLDWRVTARTGKPHTKVFQEERERPVLVIMDMSDSMYFGTRGCLKVVQAARLTALVGWAAVRRGDRIGCLMYHNGRHYEVRPAGGRRGALRLVNVMVKAGQEFAPGHIAPASGSMEAAVKRARRIARPGSLIFLVSDFYGLTDDCHRHVSYLRQHNDVVACRVVDPIELELPPPGAYPISDGQTQGMLDLRSAPARERYRQFLRDGEQRYTDLCNRHALTRMTLRTPDDPTDALSRVFSYRDAA
ncbi:MAG: DUF58 domain-containing protein [Xanthomonadales bacterium]|nr:DUF58 domain-containing protein [Xanthomonadales bacterium]